MKVLIVEDNKQMRREIKLFLQGVAGEIRECSDGSELLAAYDELLPDWVLMDIKMKQVDGLAATRQIKAKHPEARIIIVTSYDDAHLREAARSAGACEYVLKDNLLVIRQFLISESL